METVPLPFVLWLGGLLVAMLVGLIALIHRILAGRIEDIELRMRKSEEVRGRLVVIVGDESDGLVREVHLIRRAIHLNANDIFGIKMHLKLPTNRSTDEP